MTTEKNDWERFCVSASAVMREFLGHKISLEKAIEFFENDPTISDGDLREYVENTLCEIGGSPGYYMELLELFESRATEAELVQYFKNGKTSIQEITEFFGSFILKLKRLFQ